MRYRDMLCRSYLKFFSTTGLVLVLMLPGHSYAELWRFTPSIALEGRYDDNIRLVTVPHDDVTGVVLRGNLGFSRLTERSGVTGRLHLDLSDYSGDEQVTNNNENIHLGLTSYVNTERTKLGFNGLYRRDTTLKRIGILEEPIDDGLIDDDIDEGLVNVDIRRNRLRLAPYWRYNLTERTDLGLSYSYTDVWYDKNSVGSGLFDYDQHVVNVGVFRRLTERDTINAKVGVGRFESPDNSGNEVDSYSLTVGFKRQLSETTSGSINVGVNHSEQNSNVSSSETDGFVFRMNLNHKTELTRYKLSLMHDLHPSGSGNISEASQLRLRVTHNFSSRLSGLLGMRYIEEEIIGVSQPDTRNYYAIEPGLSWKVTRWWTLAGGYNYRNSKRDSSVDAAESNAVYISLGYSKPTTLD